MSIQPRNRGSKGNAASNNRLNHALCVGTKWSNARGQHNVLSAPTPYTYHSNNKPVGCTVMVVTSEFLVPCEEKEGEDKDKEKKKKEANGEHECDGELCWRPPPEKDSTKT